MANLTVDLNAVVVLAKVLELRSFRGAARALDVRRSTVSLKIKQLEEQVGVKLLERTTRAVRPTEAGNAYLRTAIPALEALNDAGRVAAGLARESSGLLRVTAPPELGQVLFGPVLARFLSQSPQVRVYVELTARRVSLVEEGFDVVVRAGELSDSTLLCRAIGQPESLITCASPGYLKQRGIPLHPKELVHHRCLAMSERQDPTRWAYQDKGKYVATDVNPTVSINSFLVCRDLAIAGQGIARVPRFLVRGQIADGSLVEILERFALPRTAFHALYTSSSRLLPKVRDFVAILEAVSFKEIDRRRT